MARSGETIPFIDTPGYAALLRSCSESRIFVARNLLFAVVKAVPADLVATEYLTLTLSDSESEPARLQCRQLWAEGMAAIEESCAKIEAEYTSGSGRVDERLYWTMVRRWFLLAAAFERLEKERLAGPNGNGLQIAPEAVFHAEAAKPVATQAAKPVMR